MAEFTKILPASCLRGSGLVLPPDFRDAVVKASGDFVLEDDAGKQWHCSITRKNQGGHERCDITGGWRVFAAGTNMQAGDEILVKHMGGKVIQITKTGKTGNPRTPRTPAARKTPARTPGKTPVARPGSKTPTSVAAGGVAKRRGSSSTGKKQPRAAAAAAAMEGAGPASGGRRRRSSQGAGAAAAASPAQVAMDTEEEEPQQQGGSAWCTIM